MPNSLSFSADTPYLVSCNARGGRGTNWDEPVHIIINALHPHQALLKLETHLKEKYPNKTIRLNGNQIEVLGGIHESAVDRYYSIVPKDDVVILK